MVNINDIDVWEKANELAGVLAFIDPRQNFHKMALLAQVRGIEETTRKAFKDLEESGVIVKERRNRWQWVTGQPQLYRVDHKALVLYTAELAPAPPYGAEAPPPAYEPPVPTASQPPMPNSKPLPPVPTASQPPMPNSKPLPPAPTPNVRPLPTPPIEPLSPLPAQNSKPLSVPPIPANIVRRIVDSDNEAFQKWQQAVARGTGNQDKKDPEISVPVNSPQVSIANAARIRGVGIEYRHQPAPGAIARDALIGRVRQRRTR